MDCLTPILIGFHVASGHIPNTLNNFNPGIRVQTECGVTGGVYWNSYRKVGAYIGYTYDPANSILWGSLVAATGYKVQTGLPISPVLMGGIKAPITKTITARFGVIPPVPKYNPYVIGHVMFEIKL